MMVLNSCVSVPFVKKLHSMRMHCYMIYYVKRRVRFILNKPVLHMYIVHVCDPGNPATCRDSKNMKCKYINIRWTSHDR